MAKSILTVKLNLETDKDSEKLLRQVIQQYTESFNRISKIAWNNPKDNKVKIHHKTYYTERELTTFGSQLVCSAIAKSFEAVKAGRTSMKNGKKASCPKSNFCSVRYDARTMSFHKDQIVSLKVCDKRIKLKYEFPKHQEHLKDWDFGSADLVYKKGKFYLHLSVSKEIDILFNGLVVGCDMGITRPIVTSENQFFGQRRWKYINRKYFKHQRSLQAKGTKSAKRRLKKVSGRRNRFSIDCDHVISKRLVQSQSKGTLIALEDLTNINKQNKKRKSKKEKRRFSEWSYFRRRSFIEYKATMNGCGVVLVNPAYTSQTCSCCGNTEPNNRNRSVFKCVSCGLELNADLNAARVIKQSVFGRSKDAGLTVIQPIVDAPGLQAPSFMTG